VAAADYFGVLDPRRLSEDYPIGSAFMQRYRGMSDDALRAIQQRRFHRLMTRAWQVPFYRRLWGRAGIEPGDLRGLEDIIHLPVFSKSELMESVAAHPPLGDFHGLDERPPAQRPPLILPTPSGTTGTPPPLLFGPWVRHVQPRLLARPYLLPEPPPCAVAYCAARRGPIHHLWEDAHFIEVLDMDSGAVVEPGRRGDLVVTCLYKDDVYPIVRFNTHDLTEVLHGSNAMGLPFRRIRGFLGRSDNMVKLRGVNVFPQGIGPLLEARPEFAGEFLCIVERDAHGRDEMCVSIEVTTAADEHEALAPAFRALLRQRLGVELNVALVAPGSLAPMTGIQNRQKPVRLIDRRKGS